VKLLGPVAHEEIVIREGLDPGGLPDRETAGLGRAVMGVVVAVLGDMRGHRIAGLVGQLDLEEVGECNWTIVIYVLVLGEQSWQ